MRLHRADYNSVGYNATMPRKPARNRRAYAAVDTVTVRCPRCRARLAEAWPERNASGRDVYVIPFAKPVPPADTVDAVAGAERWRCQRCRTLHNVDRVQLHEAVRDAGGTPPEVILGERRSAAASRSW